MKKILSVILVAAISIVFVGCGSDINTTPTQDTTVTSKSDEIVKEESAPAEIAESTESEAITEDTTAEVAFDELIAVDNDECLIKITEVDEDDFWGFTLKAYLENKSTEKTYMYSITNASINGVKADPVFASEVAAGKKAYEQITFLDSELDPKVIGPFSDIELSFKVYDSDDWMAEPVAEETVHVYPYGQDKAEKYARTVQPTDTVLVDNEKIGITVIGYEEDSLWGYTVKLYITNKTDKEMMFSVSEASVNGFMMDPFWATSVCPGNVAFSSMSWMDSDFEENGIETVESIEMQLRAYDAEDWSADDVYNEVVTLNP